MPEEGANGILGNKDHAIRGWVGGILRAPVGVCEGDAFIRPWGTVDPVPDVIGETPILSKADPVVPRPLKVPEHIASSIQVTLRGVVREL